MLNKKLKWYPLFDSEQELKELFAGKNANSASTKKESSLKRTLEFVLIEGALMNLNKNR
jgi:hypothetical protein